MGYRRDRTYFKKKATGSNALWPLYLGCVFSFADANYALDLREDQALEVALTGNHGADGKPASTDEEAEDTREQAREPNHEVADFIKAGDSRRTEQ